MFSYLVEHLDAGFFFTFSVILNQVVLSTRTSSRSKTFTDCYVVFKDHEELDYGCIEAIFHITSADIYLVKVKVLQISHFDSLLLNGKQYLNQNIIYGNFSNHQSRIISASDIVEKGCFYDAEECSFFARLPNMYESS